MSASVPPTSLGAGGELPPPPKRRRTLVAVALACVCAIGLGLGLGLGGSGGGSPAARTTFPPAATGGSHPGGSVPSRSASTVPPTGPKSAGGPGAPVADSIDGVSCAPDGQCIAVGNSDVEGKVTTLAELRAPRSTAWTILPSANPPRTSLDQMDAVSCPSAAWCIAVGSSSAPPRAVVEIRRGGGFDLSQAPTRATGTVLSGVACWDPARCVAVGSETVAGVERPMVERLAGRTWTRAGGRARLRGSLSSVTCASPTRCVAVGAAIVAGIERPLVLDVLGRHVEPHVLAAGTASGSLFGVACGGGRSVSCVAVGASEEAGAGARPLVYRGQAGRWVALSGESRDASDLAAISCTDESPSRCLAVGSTALGRRLQPLVLIVGAKSWTAASPTSVQSTASALDAVDCRSSCVAAGSLLVGDGRIATLFGSVGPAGLVREASASPGIRSGSVG